MSTLFCWTLKQCFSKGRIFSSFFFFFFPGGDLLYVCCHCGCCVLYQLNMTGWEGGRGEQQAWTPSAQKNNILGEKMFISRVCIRPPVEVTLYVCWMYYKVNGDMELFDLLGLLQCHKPCSHTTEWRFQLNLQESNRGGSLHVRTFTLMFQCGCIKGKYHCFLHSRIRVFHI